MTAPYKWEMGFADAYASSFGPGVADYLRWVIEPSLAALEKHRKELAQAAEDDSVFHFDLSDHERLIRRTCMTFALAIQSLWEQQLRSYLAACANGCTIEGVTQKKLEQAAWGSELNDVFYKVRGIALDGFDSYPALTQLQMLGKAAGFSTLHVFHSFRHTVVTGLVRADVPTPLAKELVGHREGSVTHDVYSKGATAAQKLAAISKLPALKDTGTKREDSTA